MVADSLGDFPSGHRIADCFCGQLGCGSFHLSFSLILRVKYFGRFRLRHDSAASSLRNGEFVAIDWEEH